MLVQEKRSQADWVDGSVGEGRWGKLKSLARLAAEKLHFMLHQRDKSVRFQFSNARYGASIADLAQNVDALNFHWINQGFQSLKGIRQLANAGKKIFFTLHDMWYFTGGCHYTDQCREHLRECGNCPLLRRPHAGDLSHKLWKEKQALYENLDLRIITPSAWMKTQALESSLFRRARIEVIPNCIDTELYAPLSESARQDLRREYKLPTDKRIIFCFAMNLQQRRKGLHLLLESFRYWQQIDPTWAKNTLLLVGGKADESSFAKLPCEVRTLGYLTDRAQICAAYQLADLFVTPSLEDNLPNTVMESLACGTPVVAFDTGGIPEMVEHLHNGYIADYADPQALALGLSQSLQSDENLLKMRHHARKSVDKYQYETVAAQLMQYFQQ